MFGRNKKKEILMQALKGYKPTSKSSLKHFCLVASDCNVDEAEKLYNFLIKDMEDLPTFDPLPTTWVDNTKSTLKEFMDFFKENQDTISQGYQFISGILSKKSQANTAKNAIESLPKIN